jgi:hypothetical protein
MGNSRGRGSGIRDQVSGGRVRSEKKWSDEISNFGIRIGDLGFIEKREI